MAVPGVIQKSLGPDWGVSMVSRQPHNWTPRYTGDVCASADHHCGCLLSESAPRAVVSATLLRETVGVWPRVRLNLEALTCSPDRVFADQEL